MLCTLAWLIIYNVGMKYQYNEQAVFRFCHSFHGVSQYRSLLFNRCHSDFSA